MKRVLMIAVLLAAVLPVQAKEKSYEKGVLLRMESASCGSAEKGSKTIVGEVLGTDGEHKSTGAITLAKRTYCRRIESFTGSGRKMTSIQLCCQLARRLNLGSRKTNSFFVYPKPMIRSASIRWSL